MVHAVFGAFAALPALILPPICAVAFAQQSPLPEVHGSSIGYPSAAAALKGVNADPAFKLSTQRGWTIAVDEATHTFWAFPPPGNPAYPAAVKRHLVDKPNGIYIEMAVHCEATKAACDKLVTDFKALNATIGKNIEPQK